MYSIHTFGDHLHALVNGYLRLKDHDGEMAARDVDVCYTSVDCEQRLVNIARSVHGTVSPLTGHISETVRDTA